MIVADKNWELMQAAHRALPSSLIRWQCTPSVSSAEICTGLSLWDHTRKNSKKRGTVEGKGIELCRRLDA